MYESKQLSMSWCNRFAYFNEFPSSLSGINKFSFLLKGKVVWEIKHQHVFKDNTNIFVRSGIRTNAHIRGPERSCALNKQDKFIHLSLAP